ncbi:MAG: beta-propeller domain-containing protein [Acholeplasmataceae bacterium]
MTTTGIVLSIIFGGLLAFFLVQFIVELNMNHRLRTFQKTQNIILKKTWGFTLKRSFMVLLTTGLFGVTLLSGSFNQPQTPYLNNIQLVNAQAVGSRSNLETLINQQNQGSFWDRFFGVDDMAPMPEAGLDNAAGEENQQQNPDFIDTNVQVEGVLEADIAKTDGYVIYYAARYQNKVRVMDIGTDDRLITVLDDIDLGDFSVENLYLTEDYLVLIGYTISMQSAPSSDGEVRDFFWGYYHVYTGSVIVIDRETLEIAYQLESDGYIYDHRMIDDTLFLVSRKNLYDDDLRPMFKETINDEQTTTHVDYDNIYYFDDIPIQSMTVLSSIDLSSFNLNSQAFLTDVSHLYVSKNAIYTAFNFSEYDNDNNWYQKTQIVKYSLDVETSEIIYKGQKIIDGHVGNQFWMDEYEGYFRVVTNQWNPILNRLYILEENELVDELDLASVIDEGLGKPNERVMSVRFNRHLAYIVTFEQIDPLYTIDMTDPYEPIFIGDIEMPGFSTYLHPWLEDHYVIGLGFDADLNGMVTGLKIDAYDTRLSEPLQSYVLGQDGQAGYSYSYSEAHYNHKALLVSAEKGLFGFPVMTYIYHNAPTYRYEYLSQYYIFNINFDHDPIISDPIIISHDPSEYYYPVERGVYINGVIYTLSFQQVISYDLESGEILENILFDPS